MTLFDNVIPAPSIIITHNTDVQSITHISLMRVKVHYSGQNINMYMYMYNCIYKTWMHKYICYTIYDTKLRKFYGNVCSKGNPATT